MYVPDLNVSALQGISFHFSNVYSKHPKLISQLPKAAVIVFITLLLSLGMQSAAFALLAAVEQAEQVDNSFRKVYPFHIQIIGLTSPLNDQSRVLIISEPPPHISPEYFQNLVDSLGGKAFVKTHRIGYDGWTRDAVLALPPLSKDKLSVLLTQLHRDLYGTAYKANAVQLPIKPPPASNRSLDLSVSVGDLNNWLNKKDLKFTPTIGGASRSLPEIISSKQSGVFISTQRGLVIWSIPRGQDLAKYRAEARQFFLDSDLIVGAIANDSQLAIVARERVEPILRLPPLRVETALMLAAERSDRLAQSYERTNLFSGRLLKSEDKGKDWAPIYLSDRLINTEFGSLLNITDQLLKSWSLDGGIEYVNFNYPKPSKWIPFPQPMRKILQETGSVLFNWNTAGAGYTTSINSYDFFALNRTGALPITYGARAELVKTYESTAYDYFSKLENRELVRVVQYTVLFQIFHKLGITTTESKIQGSVLPGTKVLESEATNFLQKLQRLSPEEQTQKIQMLGLNPQAEKVFNEKITNLRSVINQGTTRWNNAAISELSQLLASPKPYNPVIADPVFVTWLYSNFPAIFEATSDLKVRFFAKSLTDIEKVKERYVEALSKDSNTWIKTPSIVLSKDIVDFEVVGGHNLNSKLTQLRASSSVPIGKVQLITDETNPIILYNPKDVGKIHSLSRKLTTELTTTTDVRGLTNSLEKTLRETPENPRLLTQALNLPTESSTSIQQGSRGLTRSLEPPTSSPPLGWRLRDNPLTPDEAQRLVTADRLGTRSIIIERSTNGYAIVRSGSNQAVEAHNVVSFYDDVLPQFMNSMPENSSPIQIYLNGFTSDEAQGLRLTGDLRQKAQQVAFRGKRPFSENIALLKNSYDWNGAVIKEIKVDSVSIGPTSGYRQIIDVEVIPTIPNRPSLQVRFVTFVKELPKQIADRIAAIVKQVLARPSSQSRNVNQVIFDIRQELRKEFPDIDIDVQVEAGDIYITEPARGNRYVRRMSYDN